MVQNQETIQIEVFKDKPRQELKKDRLQELEQYKEDGVLEPANVDFLSKLIKRAESVEEVENLSTLSVIDKSSGLIFQPTLEKVRGGEKSATFPRTKSSPSNRTPKPSPTSSS